MQGKEPSLILDRLLALTNAKVLKPTAEELRQIQEIEEQKRRSEKDAELMAKVNEKRKREKQLLIQARGDVDA
jgi:large subunit ribosomal protein MRP49